MMTKIPAAAPTTIALSRVLTFSSTSAFASSISSCTSSDTRSEISVTACATFWGVVSVAKATQDHGREDAARERGADDELGALVGEDPDRLERVAGRCGRMAVVGRRG